jgi:predicted transcriptional regulator
MLEELDLETRRKIYHLIKKHPGLNLSSIAELLGMNVPLVDYHTRCMAENELLVIVKEDGFKRYYVKGIVGIKDKKFLGVLRQEIPLKIVLFLLDNPFSKHKEILKNFDLAGSTLTYHINKLVKQGIVYFNEATGERGYVITNKEEVIRFLIRYKPSKVLRRFKETWADDFTIP